MYVIGFARGVARAALAADHVALETGNKLPIPLMKMYVQKSYAIQK